MLRTVLLFKRPSLCFVFIIVQTVERFRPSAMAWSSRELYPPLVNASAMS